MQQLTNRRSENGRRRMVAHGKRLREGKGKTRQQDDLARQRSELPWVKVETDYVFAAPQGKVEPADLFGPQSQLVVYHFMFGPDWPEGCPSCSYVWITSMARPRT